MARAPASGIILSVADAALIKGMLDRGDRQHDIAAWFGVNGGRITEIARGAKFEDVKAASSEILPPPGPYPTGSQAVEVIHALAQAKAALSVAESSLRRRANR